MMGNLPPIGPWMMWAGIGLPTYLTLCMGIGKFAAAGKTEAESQADLQEEYMAACLSGDERRMGATTRAFIERGAK